MLEGKSSDIPYPISLFLFHLGLTEIDKQLHYFFPISPSLKFLEKASKSNENVPSKSHIKLSCVKDTLLIIQLKCRVINFDYLIPLYADVNLTHNYLVEELKIVLSSLSAFSSLLKK